MLWKCCTQYASKFGKLSSSCRTGKAVFILKPKKSSTKECSNYHTITLISHASKVMLKIFKLDFNSMWTKTLQMHDWNLEKVEEPEIIHRITAKAGKFQKNIYFCFIDYAKPFDCVDHDKLWKILKKKVIPDHLTCSLRTCIPDHLTCSLRTCM